MESIISVTAQFIVDFKLQSKMLSCSRFYATHTSHNIHHSFQEITKNYNIDKQIMVVVTDNATNMCKRFRLLDIFDEIETESEDDSIDSVSIENPESITCFAHTIQLVVQDGLKHAENIKRLLNKASRSIDFIKSSTEAGHEICTKVQQTAVPQWNKKMATIRSLLQVPANVMETIEHGSKLSACEMKVLKDICEVLTPFEWAINMIQGNTVTASIVVPSIRGLGLALEELSEKFLPALVQAFKTSVEKRLTEYDTPMFHKAAALDPRWKLGWCDEGEENKVRQLIVDELRQSYPQLNTTSEETAPPPLKRCMLLSYMKNKGHIQNSSNDINHEIDSYFSEPCISEDSDPLEYWKSKNSTFPKLANIACQYLQIPASSTPVEHVLSIAGKIFRPDRCNLSDDIFEQLIYIACNSNC